MNPFFTLLVSRWRRLLLFALPSFAFIAPMLRAPVVGIRVVDTTIFSTLFLLMPLTWGSIFAAILHEALHTPSTALLPGVGRRLFRGHAAATIVVSLPWGWMGYHLGPQFSFPTLCAVTGLCFALFLPWGPGWRWSGSRILMIPAVGLLILLGFYPHHIWILAEKAPAAVTASALALTVLCYAAASRRSQLRARALSRHTSYFSTLFSETFARRRAEEKIAQKNYAYVTWSAPVRDDSTRWWLKALCHERTNTWGRLSWLGTLAAAALLTTLVAAAMGRYDGTFIERIYALTTYGNRSRLDILGLVLVMQMVLVPLPRPRWLYPLSRTRRAQLSFVSVLGYLGMGCLVFAAGLAALGLGAAAWLGRDFSWMGYACVLANTAAILPFAPLVYWGRLHLDVRDSRLWFIVMLIAAMIFQSLLRALVWRGKSLSPENISGAGLANTLLLFVVALGLLYAGLRYFHRRGDLLQRGTGSSGFSMV